MVRLSEASALNPGRFIGCSSFRLRLEVIDSPAQRDVASRAASYLTIVSEASARRIAENPRIAHADWLAPQTSFPSGPLQQQYLKLRKQKQSKMIGSCGLIPLWLRGSFAASNS